MNLRYQLSFILFAIVFFCFSPGVFAQQERRITVVAPDVLPSSHVIIHRVPVNIRGIMPDALYFPKSLKGNPSEALTAVQRLEIKSNRLGGEYHDKLDDTHPFAGLYAVGRVDSRVGSLKRQNDRRNDYLYGLEWEIFKQGYHEYKRDLDEKKIASQVQSLQIENDMRMRALNEQIFHLNSLRRTVQALSTKNMLDLTTMQLAKAKKQMAHGYITRDEYIENVNRQLDAEIRYTRLAANSPVKVPPTWFEMLNVAPSLRLAPEGQLFEQAVRASPNLLLQDQFEKRADFFPEWKDNLSVRLFAHRRQRFSTSAESVVGVRVRIPLDIQPYRQGVVDIEKESYRVQASAIRARLKQKITQLSSEFQFQQARIAQLADDYVVLGKKIMSARQLAKVGIPYLKQTPEKDIAVYNRERLMTVETVWLARIDVLEKVLRLAAMTHARRKEELFLDKIADTSSDVEKTYKPSMVIYNESNLQKPLKEALPDNHLERKAIMDTIESWRAAWSAKKQKKYFQFYADNFTPEQHDTIATWKKHKQRLFTIRQSIDVKLTRIKIKFMENNSQSRVRFYQQYHAGQYHSNDTKELLMQRIGGRWKIIREHRIPLDTLNQSSQTEKLATKKVDTDMIFEKASIIEPKVDTVFDKKKPVYIHTGNQPEGIKNTSVNQAVLYAVEVWRSAWTAKDLPDYFHAYADHFTPSEKSQTREAWKQYKIRIISGKKRIQIALHNLHVEVDKKKMRAVVQFQQVFDSNNYTSRDDKELTLEKQADGWKIIQEKVL